jgi:P-type Ca2+ transporter type 2B
MDSLASLALATSQPTKNLLNRLPYSRNSSIISRNMIKNIFFQVIYQLTVIIVLLTVGPSFIKMDNKPVVNNNFLIDCPCAKNLHEPSEHLTIVLNTFVLMTLFNEINSRKIHSEHNIFEGLFSNIIFCIIWLVTLVLQIIIVNYGSYAFSVKKLSLEQWAWCLLFGLGTLIFQQLVSVIQTEKIPEKIEDINELKKYASKDTLSKMKHSRVLWLRGFNKVI